MLDFPNGNIVALFISNSFFDDDEKENEEDSPSFLVLLD